jgi:hypothetical protein
MELYYSYHGPLLGRSSVIDYAIASERWTQYTFPSLGDLIRTVSDHCIMKMRLLANWSPDACLLITHDQNSEKNHNPGFKFDQNSINVYSHVSSIIQLSRAGEFISNFLDSDINKGTESPEVDSDRNQLISQEYFTQGGKSLRRKNALNASALKKHKKWFNASLQVQKSRVDELTLSSRPLIDHQLRCLLNL